LLDAVETCHSRKAVWKVEDYWQAGSLAKSNIMDVGHKQLKKGCHIL
jgi:hypothetical protein